MTITQAEIDDLRRLIEAATPGPWSAMSHSVEGEDADELIAHARFPNDAAYIAAANPERIKRLLDAHKAQAERIETLEKALASAHERLYEHGLCLCDSDTSLQTVVYCEAATALGETEEG